MFWLYNSHHVTLWLSNCNHLSTYTTAITLIHVGCHCTGTGDLCVFLQKQDEEHKASTSHGVPPSSHWYPHTGTARLSWPGWLSSQTVYSCKDEAKKMKQTHSWCDKSRAVRCAKSCTVWMSLQKVKWPGVEPATLLLPVQYGDHIIVLNDYLDGLTHSNFAGQHQSVIGTTTSTFSVCLTDLPFHGHSRPGHVPQNRAFHNTEARSLHTVCHSRHPIHHHHNRFTAIFPGPRGWASAKRELVDFMVQRKINRGRHTDRPAGRHSIWIN